MLEPLEGGAFFATGLVVVDFLGAVEGMAQD